MNWKNKRVLVTGAGGFIGSHLVEKLVQSGARTVGFVHYNSSGSRGWLDHSPCRGDVEVFAGDVCDRDSVKAAMKGADVVFHLAALIAIPYSYHAPALYARTNVEGTLNVLQAARDLGVGRVVHTSSSEVYGTARKVPIREDHPLQGQSPYSASKIAADKFVEAFHRSFGVPTVTVRPFNTFGPRQSARAIIPTIVTQCLVGDRVRLGNLRPTRDLNFVGNTVDGFLRAALSPRALGQTINLGSGKEISIGDLVRVIAGQMGKKVIVRPDRRRVRPKGSEVERLLADTGLARRLLAWKPEVSLEEGLRITIPWIRSNLNRFRPHEYAL